MKNKKYILIILFLILCICSLYVLKENENVNLVNVNAQVLSNKKIGWGIKRATNHEQPDLGSYNKSTLEEYDGIAMGNSEKKQVYLTFDEGYEAGYTSSILDTLKANNVTATFFITAHYLNSQPDLVKRMIDEGHIIGNHTVNHYSLPEKDDETIKNEVMNLHTAIYEKFGYEMQYIRPPKGEYSQRTLKLCKELGYTTVMWSFAYDDWDEKNQDRTEYAKQKILDNVHPGAIILLHGNSKDNTNVLDYCIKEIKNMGYEFKSLDAFE